MSGCLTCIVFQSVFACSSCLCLFLVRNWNAQANQHIKRNNHKLHEKMHRDTDRKTGRERQWAAVLSTSLSLDLSLNLSLDLSLFTETRLLGSLAPPPRYSWKEQNLSQRGTSQRFVCEKEDKKQKEEREEKEKTKERKERGWLLNGLTSQKIKQCTIPGSSSNTTPSPKDSRTITQYPSLEYDTL